MCPTTSLDGSQRFDTASTKVRYTQVRGAISDGLLINDSLSIK